MNHNTRTILIACIMLLLGFGVGFIVNTQTRVATAKDSDLPINRTWQSLSLLPANDRADPELWRLSVDPFWTPSLSPGAPLLVPGLSNFPMHTPVVKTSMGDKEVRMQVNLPGLTDKDVDVHVSSNQVTIKGQKEQQNEKGNNVQTMRQSFEEAVSLPCKVDGGKARATVKDGVLTISIPKVGNGIAQSSDKSWH